MHSKIYTVYAPADDMTFIMKDRFYYINNGDKEPCSTEVIGFYFGSPDEETTADAIGHLKAEF